MAKILTESKKLNYSIILFLIIAAFVIIFGAILAILGTFVSYQIEYTGKTESEVKAYSSELMLVISSFIRLLGIYQISLGITAIFITFHGIRKKEKWAWWNFLIIIPMIIIPSLIIDFLVTGLLGIPFLLLVVTAILWIIAQSISYTEIF